MKQRRMAGKTRARSPLDERDDNIHGDSIEAVGEDVHGIDLDEEFVEPTPMDAPPPRPGFKQLWVRTRVANQPDADNVNSSFQRGWVPRKASSVANYTGPTIKHDSYGDVIGIGGMILCEMPIKRWNAMQAYYARKTEKLTEFVNQNRFAEEVPGHSIEKKRLFSISNKAPEIAAE